MYAVVEKLTLLKSSVMLENVGQNNSAGNKSEAAKYCAYNKEHSFLWNTSFYLLLQKMVEHVNLEA